MSIGKNPRQYLGVRSLTPPNLTIQDHAPNQYDYDNFDVGDWWLVLNVSLWYLQSKVAGVATWKQVITSGGAIVSVVGGHDITVTTVAGVATVALNNAITLGDLVSIPNTPALEAISGDIRVDSGLVRATPNTVGVGNSSSIQALNGWLESSNTLNISNGPGLIFEKQRSGTIVQNGDTLAFIEFDGFDGTIPFTAADIQVTTRGTPASGSVTASFGFFTYSTTASMLKERFDIGSAGNIVIPAPDSGTSLTLSALAAGALVTSTSGQVSAADGNTAGFVLTSNGTNVTPTFQANPSAGAATSFVTNPATGTATPAAGVITVAGTGTTTVTAAGSTITINSTGGGGASTSNFQVANQSGVTNVWGGGAGNVIVPFDTVKWDVGSNFAANVFTAPATGYYYFYWNFFLDGVSASHTGGGQIALVATSGSWWSEDINYRAMSISTGANPNYVMLQGNTVVNMTAGDTAQLQIEVVGGATTVGLAPFATGIFGNYWGGYRIA